MPFLAKSIKTGLTEKALFYSIFIQQRCCTLVSNCSFSASLTSGRSCSLEEYSTDDEDEAADPDDKSADISAGIHIEFAAREIDTCEMKGLVVGETNVIDETNEPEGMEKCETIKEGDKIGKGYEALEKCEIEVKVVSNTGAVKEIDRANKGGVFDDTRCPKDAAFNSTGEKVASDKNKDIPNAAAVPSFMDKNCDKNADSNVKGSEDTLCDYAGIDMKQIERPSPSGEE